MISSRTNARILHAVRVREGHQPELVFVEGARLCAELLGAGWSVETAFHTAETEDLASKAGAEKLEVNESVMQKLAGTVSPQGIVMIARKLEMSPELDSSGLLLALDAVQDPGNIGTLVRTAEAAGASGVVLLEGCANPFSPKALRASMGSAFRLPIKRMQASDFVLWAKSSGVKLAAAAGGGSSRHTEIDWTLPTALIMGNEGNGVSQAMLEASNQCVRIPLHGRVESLNVAAAAAVLLFEAARQRSQGS